MIQTVSAHADGEKNDAPLVPDLLAELRTQPTSKPRIIVADAQFCDLVQINQYCQAGDHFALRYHPKVHFHGDPTKLRREFTDAKGRHLVEEYGRLGSPADKRRRYVRRVTWKRTDHKDLSVVTDLTNRQPGQDTATPEPIPAADLVDLYLTRWKIETVFQDVTVVFGLRKLIGSAPEATAFQAAFCMVVYNAIQVVKSYVAAVQPKPMRVDDVSNTMLFTSICKELTAIAVLVPAASLAELVLPPKTTAGAAKVPASTLDRRVGTGLEKSANKNPAATRKSPKARAPIRRCIECCKNINRIPKPATGLVKLCTAEGRGSCRAGTLFFCVQTARQEPRPPEPASLGSSSMSFRNNLPKPSLAVSRVYRVPTARNRKRMGRNREVIFRECH